MADHTDRQRACFNVSLSYEQTRLGMAFHEAGHAVLSLAYGIRVTEAEVIAWRPEEGGWRVTGRTGHEANNISPWHFAAMGAAGSLAQVEYLLRYGLWTPESAAACAAEHDRELAVDTLARHGIVLGRDHVPEGGKSWGMVRGMARRKVTHLWHEIRTVARALNERDRLTGDEIAALTGLTNPSFAGGAA
ncbi:hypothetical protein OG946_31210 [Streptomyces sp. NBC_01808]|uniref:hypothetical protein n=1 Tax=Streptomyces sp. NBC_01808 TaxID=2975947 RepID=UPI002DDA4042|nr:hypothetical protein [Streptomyces sp. NBC_01808]WSA41461.1 hypothetical protein OG946_31210 [Streptomyces sp. NBC_01808]